MLKLRFAGLPRMKSRLKSVGGFASLPNYEDFMMVIRLTNSNSIIVRGVDQASRIEYFCSTQI